MELKARAAVADVYERRARVLLYSARTLLNGLQDDDARLLRDRDVLARREVEVELAPAFGLIKGGRARVQHLLNVRGNGAPLFLHPLDRLLDADCVPSLEDSEFPTEAPLHRAVDFDDRVGDLRNPVRRVREDARHRLPKERARALLSPHERLHARARLLYVLRRVERGEFCLLLRPVFERSNVQSPDVSRAALALSLLVEAALRLVAEDALAHHLLDEGGKLVDFALLVLGPGLVKIARDVCEHVQTDDVERAERRGLRAAQRGPRHLVHFFNR